MCQCTDYDGDDVLLNVTTDHSLAAYVKRLKRVYQNPPATWLPLPVSKHIKLAMTKEKGMRYGCVDVELMRHRVKGEVEQLMASKVLVDMDSIFDNGTFEKNCQMILVEGALGSGKTTLAHHYCHKWANGNLTMFDLVALVYMRDPAVHSAGLNMSLHQLLLVASGNDESAIVGRVTQRIKDGLKFLLILEGWDEAPACLRAPPDLFHTPDNSFLGKLLRSVSPNTTVLITSRPDSSVNLHKRVNRVEILGFTKESIHDYFQEALSTQLSSDEVRVECSKLKEHFGKYPAIESSCYIPLNAAILTLVYLERNCTLPTTQYELLHQLLLCCIDREVNTRQLNQVPESISSLDDLPHDLKEHLNNICKLAYEGIMQDKVVFSKQEISSLLPLPVQQDLPAMGVLQKVQWAGMRSQMSYSFGHLSIQELLAAYYISKMEESEQASVFQTLLGKLHFSSVLQFYAGFTKLTNQGVRDIITGTNFTSDKFSLLSYIRCFFEAQVDDRSLLLQILLTLNGKLNLSGVTMSPIDCMAVGYFLAFTDGISVNLSGCSIEHSFGFIMREPSSAGALLHRVTELNISYNKIGDKGAICIATALRTSICIMRLDISNCGISHEGAESLARALAVNKSLQELDVSNNEVARIVTALETNRTLKTLNMRKCGISREGAESLAEALAVNRTLQNLDVSDNEVARIVTALETNRTLKTLNMRKCGIYCRGESLGKLIVNKSLYQLNLSDNNLGDVIAHIATALQTNTTLRTLNVSHCEMQVGSLVSAIAAASLQELYIHENYGTANIASAFCTNKTLRTVSIGGKTATDEEVMRLAEAFTGSKSIECLSLLWHSISGPLSSLLTIGDYVRTSSNLRRLYLYIARHTVEDRKRWLQFLTSGAQYLIRQLENSSLQLLCLNLLYTQKDEVSDVRQALDTIEAEAVTMNSERRSEGLPDIEVICCDQ